MISTPLVRKLQAEAVDQDLANRHVVEPSRAWRLPGPGGWLSWPTPVRTGTYRELWEAYQLIKENDRDNPER